MERIDGIDWDYGPNDKIDYFDITKSYYLSKYRPINDTMGLDFDPNWFREAAISKTTTGKYSNLQPGSRSQRLYWEDQKNKCTVGMTVNGYTITGDNYFWLNFYRLKSENVSTKAGGGRSIAFPSFFVFQYEYFHYLELCEILRKDAGLLKARGVGFSEMGASLCIRPYTTTANYRAMASAPSERHLKPLLAKVWYQMDFLNSETETAFKRVRMNINTNMYRRASKKDKKGDEFGHMSEIEGVIADSPEKIRGDRVERLLYEESGSDPYFEKKYTQGEALVTVMGGKRVGTRIAWGTGGDKGSNLVGLKDLVNNPDSYNVLPFHHNFTPSGKYIDTAMFIPAYRVVTDDTVNLVDKRGYTNIPKAIEYWDRERAKKVKSPKLLLIFKAEYCYTIEEALLLQGSNLFPREELAEQLAHIEIYQDTPKVHTGFLTWEIEQSSGNRTGKVKWREDSAGNIEISEHPLMSEFGTDYKNLYVGGIDSIDIGSNDSASAKNSAASDKLSDFCIVIKKRVMGLFDPRYVAIYKDRPKDPREAYENAAKLLTYFNCNAVLESTRTAITTYFRDHKYTHLLMKRPRATMPDVTKGNSNMYGTPATVKVIAHYVELIYDFCLDYSHTIDFEEIIQQLLNYSDEKKKDFDIIAAMGMAELGDEELSLRKPEAREPKGKKFQDIGWYKDGKGYRHYGVIPQNEQERNDRNRIGTSDSWLYNDTL